MDLHCQLLIYLDKRKKLYNMKNRCIDFKDELNEKFPPMRYYLEIDVMDLIDAFPDVAEVLLKEPCKFQCFCNEILFACLQSLNYTNTSVDSAQIAVNLRLTNVPQLLIRPNPPYYAGLVVFHGQLIEISKPSNYAYHTVWSCPEMCEGNEIILQYIPKNSPKCYKCRNILFENSALRKCGEQVIATFNLKNYIQSKKIVIVDDLISNLRLGCRYNVYAVVLRKKIIVWSIEEVEFLWASTGPIPEDIDKLFNICHGIPWKFIYCLASSIGIRVCPLNCFMQIKINLLLSLASVKANSLIGSAIVHVLAAGYDTGYVGELMRDAAALADRHVFLGTCNVAVSTSLIAGAGGVCVMPLPFHTYNQKLTNPVLAAIETGEVVTETSKIKLSSAVWAHGMDHKKNTLINIGSVFGTVCRGDFGEYESEIAEFVLQNAIEPVGTTIEEIQALKDMSRYIDILGGLNVTLSSRTEIVLKSYFLAARKERPRSVSAVCMGSLVATCLTSARMCRRNVANIDDAVFAVWLHVSGTPEPRFAPDEYLQTPADVKKMHEVMKKFKMWLEQFANITL